MKFSVSFIAVLGLLSMWLILSESQQAQSFIGASNFPTTSNNPYVRSELGRRMALEQAKARSIQRQQQLVSDTDKLIRMVNNLQIDMRNEDMSPSDLTKRAAEIEKLAHTVQNNMKGNS